MIPIVRTPSARHPGAILREEFLPRLRQELSQGEIADRLGISRPRLNELLNGARSVTPDTALRLARAFGTTAEFWLSAQARWDLQEQQRDRKLKRELNAIPLIADPPPSRTSHPQPEEPRTPGIHPASLVQAAAQPLAEGDGKESLRLLREFLERRGLLEEAERYVRIRAQVDALSTGAHPPVVARPRIQEFLPLEGLIRF